jgi:epoxyqueuosine reductase QueG
LSAATVGGGGGAEIRRLLSENLDAAGFYGHGFLSGDAFADVLDETRVPAEVRRRYSGSGADAPGCAERAAGAASVAVVALRYGEGEFGDAAAAGELRAGAAPDETAVRLARFARANWYRELSGRLQAAVSATIAQAARTGLALPPAKAWRRLVNSGLPEKPSAAAAGLGWLGRNGLLVAAKGKGADGPEFSSAVVLGLLLCPVDLEPPEAEPRARRCGSCRRCVESCPTGALGAAGGEPSFARELCIQHWTALAGELPGPIADALGGRLYGCDSCLEACPYFSTDSDAADAPGRLGPALSARRILELDDTALRRAFAGTALDRSWMSLDAFRRNARLALDRGGKAPESGALGDNRAGGGGRADC